jgi:hypothetical protein
MEMIQKILNIEEINYSSNLNEESLKKRIEDLFEQRTLRVEGKLTNENEFSANDKWVVINWDMPNLRRKAAYLKGKITKGEKGTLIKLKVKPNSIFPVFAIFSALLGIFFTLKSLSYTGSKFFVILGLAFIALGIIYYPLSTLLKNRLRNKIVKHLDLSKV